MRKLIIGLLFCIGLFIIIVSINSFIRNYLVSKNGVKTAGVIRNIEINYVADGPDDTFYSIICNYKDSNYIINQNLSKTNFIKGDSLELYFYPDNLEKSIYIIDSQFNNNTYISFVVGVLLFLLSIYIKVGY